MPAGFVDVLVGTAKLISPGCLEAWVSRSCCALTPGVLGVMAAGVCGFLAGRHRQCLVSGFLWIGARSARGGWARSARGIRGQGNRSVWWPGFRYASVVWGGGVRAPGEQRDWKAGNWDSRTSVGIGIWDGAWWRAQARGDPGVLVFGCWWSLGYGALYIRTRRAGTRGAPGVCEVWESGRRCAPVSGSMWVWGFGRAGLQEFGCC